MLAHIVGNVGFVFTKGDLSEVRELILEKKVAAPAKAGALAPIDVFIDAQNTGLGPEKTSFFQALSIPTKIAKGTIEILVHFFFAMIFILYNRLLFPCQLRYWEANLTRFEKFQIA